MFTKRMMDMVGSVFALALLSPLFVVIAFLVRCKLGPPALFRQIRPGRHGRPFRLLKFRTMAEDRDADGELLPDHERLTRFGQRLRSTSLDELPEFWNVLRGDMSLVGPRPLLMEYLPLYSERQARRHEVRPGLTGWAQIHGRNAPSWEERLEMDVWYVENRTAMLDLRILMKSVLVVLRREGITRAGHATAPGFRSAD